jgi:hypothetical protein
VPRRDKLGYEDRVFFELRYLSQRHGFGKQFPKIGAEGAVGLNQALRKKYNQIRAEFRVPFRIPNSGSATNAKFITGSSVRSDFLGCDLRVA